MRSDFQHLIGSPLEQALEAAAEQGFFPEVRELQMHSRRASEGERLPHVITVQGDVFLVAGFLKEGPEAADGR